MKSDMHDTSVLTLAADGARQESPSLAQQIMKRYLLRQALYKTSRRGIPPSSTSGSRGIRRGEQTRLEKATEVRPSLTRHMSALARFRACAISVLKHVPNGMIS